MDTVAPEPPEPSETAEATAERAAPRRRWKVPTSIVVTFLGIALTAWLLPAFTRQWEDRQKSRELKADLIAQMSAATVKSVLAARGYTHSAKSGSDREVRDAAENAWLLDNLQLEARR